jgi:hypothetical protein
MADDQLVEPAGQEVAGPSPTDASDPQQPIGFTVKPPRRRQTLVKDPETVLRKLIKKFNDNIEDRSSWTEQRVQRTAKYRGWREQKTYPWLDASNAHLPVIMTDVQRTADTLHNAVLSVRPVMNAKAVSSEWAEKELTVDQLLDHQVFVENKGEERVGNLINSYVEDGMWISYNPYIKEKQKLTRTYVVDYPDPGQSWDGWIMAALQSYYPQSTILPGTRAPWNWTIKTQHELTGEIVIVKVEVYHDGDDAQVQIVCHHDEVIFDGPAFIPKELEDIVVPGRCENLQPQCMANPTGAPHVFMIEYPLKDEILRLIDSGFYDEVKAEDLEKIKGTKTSAAQDVATDPQAQKQLTDDLSGLNATVTVPEGEETFTRLTFFGREDLDGDGLDEEVVYWFLKEPQILLRARYLSEVYPVTPLRRPFGMAKYIPVNGQFYAIGLIEMMESGYDIIKKTFDQMIDSGDLTNTPFGFYRPMSGIRPETMRMGPGDLYPTNDPKNDIFYPTLPQGMSAFGHNIITLVSQILDQTTLVGQLQLGGVPQGKSSALRTTSNMQSLLQQGDARPERILRRFFTGLAEIWQQFHELNKVFLPKQKMFRTMIGVTDIMNPYVTIADKTAIEGRFMFEFGASILNTNRALATGALQDMLGMLVNPLLLQLQIVTPEKIFTLLKDLIKARGQDPMKYIQSPTNDPNAGLPKISAEDAVYSVLNGYFPHGAPMEPLEQHIQKLQVFTQTPEYMKHLSPGSQQLLGQYAATKVAELQQQQAQQQMMANAQQMQQQMQGGGQGGQPGAKPKGGNPPPPQGAAGNPPVSGREMLNESLPGAGGGQNG